MTSPDDGLARLVAVPALVGRLCRREQSQDDLEWLRGWLANAERVLAAELRSDRATQEEAEAVRRDYQAPLSRLPGLQVVSSEHAPGAADDDAVPAAPPAEDGEPLADVRPALQAACVELVRRHLVEDLGQTRPLAETQLAGMLILVGRDRDTLGGRLLTFSNPDTSNGVRVVDGTTGTDPDLRHAAWVAARDLVTRG